MKTIMEISKLIENVTGSYPETINEENGIISFEINTYRGPMSIIGEDPEYDPYYNVVETDIGDDGEGVYAETLLFRENEKDGNPAIIIEGIFRRAMDSEQRANFEGTITIYDNDQSAEDDFENMLSRYHKRTAKHHLDFIRNDLLNLGRIIPLIKESERREIQDNFMQMISETIRRSMDKDV